MTRRNWQVDYDQIAPTYDRRYERNQYAEVTEALFQFVGSGQRFNILEVGCGTGHWLDVLSSHGHHVTGLDFSGRMLDIAQVLVPDIHLIRGRAESLPFPKEAFDRVFCINAIHHFPDKPAFLADVKRILRPGGKFLTVGLDPHSDRDQWYVYDYFPASLEIDKQRYPATSSLQEWMRNTGFTDCVTREVEHWKIRLPAREILKQGRLEKEATSQLSVLTDAEYQRGMGQIQAEIEQAEEKRRDIIPYSRASIVWNHGFRRSVYRLAERILARRKTCIV